MIGKKGLSDDSQGEVVSTQEEVKSNFEWYNFSWKLLLQFGSFSCLDQIRTRKLCSVYLLCVKESFLKSWNGP